MKGYVFMCYLCAEPIGVKAFHNIRNIVVLEMVLSLF